MTNILEKEWILCTIRADDSLPPRWWTGSLWDCDENNALLMDEDESFYAKMYVHPPDGYAWTTRALSNNPQEERMNRPDDNGEQSSNDSNSHFVLQRPAWMPPITTVNELAAEICKCEADCGDLAVMLYDTGMRAIATATTTPSEPQTLWRLIQLSDTYPEHWFLVPIEREVDFLSSWNSRDGDLCDWRKPDYAIRVSSPESVVFTGWHSYSITPEAHPELSGIAFNCEPKEPAERGQKEG